MSFPKVLSGILILLFISGCKKGENDPLFSFRTRKARVVGNWTMVSGKEESKQPGFTIITTYKGTENEVLVTYSNGQTITYFGTGVFTIDFKKDGKVSVNRTFGDLLIFNGTWNFTGNVGKVKNKQQILLHNEHFAGNGGDILYTIKELRNKKLVLITELKTGFTEEYTYREEFVFEQ